VGFLECNAFVDAGASVGELDRRCYGQFIEHLGQCIYGGIWVGKNSKIPNIKGFRLDVLEAIKELQPAVVRWPGGNFSSGYHWIDGVGPSQRRPARYDMAWGAEEPNTFGTDEFMQWCSLVGTEPFIVVNAGNGTPEEAARWVEYCNSAGNTCFASLRKTHSRAEPFGVKLWGVGNELYGKWQIGYCVDGAECARRTVEFANEMRKVDSDIKIVAIGCEDPEWNLQMVKDAGKCFDYLSVHIYIGVEKTYRELVAVPINVEQRLNTVYSLVQSAKQKYKIDRDIRLAFDEWNVWYPQAKPPLLEQVTNMQDAVLTGGILNTLHRLCRQVPIGGFAQTVNVLPLIIATNDGHMVLTPQYYVFKLFSSAIGKHVLRTAIDTSAYLSSELDEQVPFVDLTATLTEDRKTAYLYIVNRHEKEIFSLTVSFRGFKPKKGLGKYIAGDSVEDRNTLDEPDKITIQEFPVKVENNKAFMELKPHSINVVKLLA
jgi:alpha-N-arabinofuranosidase